MPLDVFREYFANEDYLDAPSHEVIFVQFDTVDRKRRGTMFHLCDADTPADIKNAMVRLKFEERENAVPENMESHEMSEEMGTISSSEVRRLRSVCENTGDVVAHGTSDFPNCATWVDNVIYDLEAKGIVSFKDDFVVPTEKKELRDVTQTGSSANQGGNRSRKSKRGH